MEDSFPLGMMVKNVNTGKKGAIVFSVSIQKDKTRAVQYHPDSWVIMENIKDLVPLKQIQPEVSSECIGCAFLVEHRVGPPYSSNDVCIRYTSERTVALSNRDGKRLPAGMYDHCKKSS